MACHIQTFLVEGNRAEHVHKKAFRRYVNASTALAVAAAATGVSAGVCVECLFFKVTGPSPRHGLRRTTGKGEASNLSSDIKLHE